MDITDILTAILERLRCNMVNKNDTFTVDIIDIGTNGEGIAKLEDGYTLFIKDAVVGDKAVVKIMKTTKSYAYARLMEIIVPSEYRVQPKCPVAKQCGGCQIQEISYEKQLEFKENKVKNNIIRIGGIKEPPMLPIIGMEKPWQYRNKAQFPVGMSKDGRVISGFYAGRTHSIIECDSCDIGIDENREIMDIIKNYMNAAGISAYNEESGKGLVRHVLIRKGFTTGEIMVCLVVNGNQLKNADALVDALLKVEGMTSISYSINKENTNVIMGKTIVNLYGNGYITDYIGDVAFRISPLSFFQVNPVQTKVLYGKALEFAGLTGKENVWDVYCGVGTISLFLAKNALKVRGVEIIPEAINDARKNAEINDIKNAEFFVGKAEDVLPNHFEETKEGADVIVVDPPRKGCEVSVLETMVKMQPKRIVYVSCDSATLARDLKFLVENGFELEKVQPVDMFPHSVHVETVILLSRKTPDAIIEIDLEMSELDLTRAESKATYKEIEEYVQNKYGLHVTNLYIAQVKREFGIIERINYNVGDGKSRVPQVTPEKREAIIDALKYFQMIEV